MDRSSTLTINHGGESLELHPTGAVHWPAERTLFLADLHIGKTAALRAESIAISDDPLAADLDRLSSLIYETEARRIVVLGDLLHSVTGRHPQTFQQFKVWRTVHTAQTFLNVRGNHDRSAGDPPAAWKFELVDEPAQLGPFQLLHDPDAARPSSSGLAGHLHPKVRLSGRGGDRINLPCFWLRRSVLILPAFCRLTGGAPIRSAGEDRVMALADSTVIEVSHARRPPASRRW